ncbi:MAG: orotate phosphoribosyltransferase [Deltaproteobacteria bacterium]|nr:MAG: orotate phosphoribosyltransferase [Deltaproteobacteria bacterium]
MEEREKLKEILKKRSYEEGDFVLSSGKKSSYYIDAKQTTLDPEGAYLCGKIFLRMIREAQKGVEAIGGPTLGADPIVTAVAVVSYLEGYPLSAFIVRKEPKGHGKGLWIEGDKALRPGMRVAVVEDVVTTGGSLLRAIEVCERFGLKVVQVLALIDREEEGREALRSKGYELEAIFKRSDLVG